MKYRLVDDEKAFDSLPLSDKVEAHEYLDVGRFYDILNDKIAGQQEAKAALSFVFLLHFTKYYFSLAHSEKEKLSKRPLILLTGPSGSGKTHMVQTLCRELSVKMIHIDATTLGMGGSWRGDDLKSMIEKELGTHCDTEWRAGMSVVFIDEIDKICGSIKSSDGDDVPLQVQRTMLRVVEGTVLDYISNRSRYRIDSNDLLFIFAGNFENLRLNRKKNNSPMGFAKNTVDATDDLHGELIKAGLIPELAGRISVAAELKRPSKKEIKKYVEADGSALSEYNKAFRDVFGLELVLTEAEKNRIAEKASKSKIGMRCIQKEVDKLVIDKILKEKGHAKRIKK